MKRMYVILGVISLLFLWALTSLGQMTITKVEVNDQPTEKLKRRMELREELHKRMRDKLLHGIGPDADLFQGMDQLMEEAMSESFGDMSELTTPSSNFKSEWQEGVEGRTLVITPQTTEQQLDISVNNNLVTIKGKAEQKSPQGTTVSSFVNSFSVPEDCDGSKVKIDQKAGKIVVAFPYVKLKAVKKPKIQQDERKPLKPSDDDVTI